VYISQRFHDSGVRKPLVIDSFSVTFLHRAEDAGSPFMRYDVGIYPTLWSAPDWPSKGALAVSKVAWEPRPKIDVRPCQPLNPKKVGGLASGSAPKIMALCMQLSSLARCVSPKQNDISGITVAVE
jgi:hypothetical protein